MLTVAVAADMASNSDSYLKVPGSISNLAVAISQQMAVAANNAIIYTAILFRGIICFIILTFMQYKEQNPTISKTRGNWESCIPNMGQL